MKKKIIGLCAILLAVSGCGKIPTLDNGEEAVITFDNDHMISINEFYNTLKETYGLDTMFVLADTYILETEFDDYKDTARETADSTVDSYIESAGGEDEFLTYLMQYETSSPKLYPIEILLLNFKSSIKKLLSTIKVLSKMSPSLALSSS